MTELTPTRRRARLLSRANLRFAAHYVEMVVAMFVGMFALAPLWQLAAPGAMDRTAAAAVIMATNMTVGMVLWMWIRRHSWPRILEMSAVMYLPFLVLLVPYWMGALSSGMLMMAAHVLMFPLMLAAMVWRRAEYRHHGHHAHGTATSG